MKNALPLELTCRIWDRSVSMNIRFWRVTKPVRQMNVKPRKSPRQARAKATVDAIVEATTQVLLKDGYERFTTARAAERAGVSVGSLYQYFPNKAALASAVIERCCQDFLAAFEAALLGRRRVRLADSIGAIVEVLVSHRLSPELHKAVLDLAPRIGVAARTEAVSQAAARAIESVLREHADEIAPDIDIAAAAIVIETMLETLAHRAVQGHPVHLRGEALAREATRFVTSYLTTGIHANTQAPVPLR
jgi:AcrR family transcriptional regulator